MKKATIVIVTSIILSIITLLIPAEINYVAAYDRQAAISYANQWTEDDPNSTLHNSEYNYYDGKDCANYVSQCLKAGGYDLEAGYDGSGGGVDNKGCMPYCDYLHTHLSEYQHVEVIRYQLAVGESFADIVPVNLQAGDVVIFGKAGGDEWKHAGIVVQGTGGDAKVNAHTSHRKNRPMSFFDTSFDVVYIYHFPTASEVGHNQEFFGTGNYFGKGALEVVVYEPGDNFEGWVLTNTNSAEQDMVIAENTSSYPGCTYDIEGYCGSAHKDIPVTGSGFGQPWTSDSPDHWAYWLRKAVEYANDNSYGDYDTLDAIWYITDRSAGDYNDILLSIGYPEDGPRKNIPPLSSVWGNSSSDVFAASYEDTIFHYDGSTWSAMSSGTTDWLYGVWGSSSSNVFAVGDYGTILQYDGSTWSAMSSDTTNRLNSVWGSSSSDVFAVGDYGTILHYDGSTWSAMSSDTIHILNSVWGSSSSNVFVVGDYGTILHYDGSNWSAMSSDTTNILNSVWGSSSSNVFAVGGYGTILHYDGSTWSAMSSDTIDWLFGVWGSSSSNVFAVGDYGTILHYDGGTWSAMSSDTTNILNSVWGSSSSNVFAVGDDGVFLLDYSKGQPTVAPVSPNQGNQGQTLNIAISGTYFTGANAVSFGSGITVNSFTVDSDTQITANITIDADATLGVRNVSVTNSYGTGTLTGGFTVTEVDGQDGDNGDGEKNGEAGGCSCGSASVGISGSDLAIGWGIIGLCWGGTYYFVRRTNKHINP